MIRKSSLAYLGLLNPAFFRLDAEYTLRASALPKTRIAWYTGYCWVRIENEMSLAKRYPKNMVDEWEKLKMIYLRKSSWANGFLFGVLRKVKKGIKKYFRHLK
ncbi:MAG: hypothetical protein FWC36_11330 [Spirochaetes bacterium]|nr:hypothetical protein [Spirochaetota bacterium]